MSLSRVRTVLLISITALILLVIPRAAAAQQEAAPSLGLALAASGAGQQSNVPVAARQAEESVEDAVRRFRVGVEAGVGVDPELIMFGAHSTFAPVFRPGVEFRPGLEMGVGELTTTLGINLDVLYLMPAGTGGGGWRPYLGAGPNFALSHRGFDTDGEDLEDDDRNRFDFSDTDFEGGFNFIAGARHRNGMFLEMKATAYGVSNVRLLVGFNF